MKMLVKAFSGERYPVLRDVRVGPRTGVVEVYDPLRRRWTTDHSLTEADKAAARRAAALAGVAA